MIVGVAWRVLVLLGASVVLTSPLLRRRYPVAWWYLVQYPVMWGRMRLTWRKLAWECDLATTRGRSRMAIGGLVVSGRELDPMVPRLWIGFPHRFRLVARVRMLPGQTPDDFVSAAEAMAHAWRAHAVRVGSPARGEVEFTVLSRDPLAVVDGSGPGTLVPAARGGGDRVGVWSSGGPAGDDASLLRAAVGTQEDGAAWVVDLRVVPHWLVAGATLSGKSTWLNALVVELAPRPVALVGIDLKGGLALAPYLPRLSVLACTRAEAVSLLAALMNEVLERMSMCRDAGVRSVWDLPAEVRPAPVVVLVDEVAELFLAVDREDKAASVQAVTYLVRLGQLGAALGVHLVVAAQRFGSELGPGATALRAQLAGRVCHRVTDYETASMTLGDKAPEAVAAAQRISPLDRGVAVTATDAGGWLRARSVNVGVQQACQVAAGPAWARPKVAGLDLDAAGGGFA